MGIDENVTYAGARDADRGPPPPPVSVDGVDDPFELLLAPPQPPRIRVSGTAASADIIRRWEKRRMA